MNKIQVYRTSDTGLLAADTLLTIIVSAFFLHIQLNIHTAISIILGFAIAVALNIIFMTKAGFWVVSILFSCIWAVLGASLVGAFSKGDSIWTWCAGAVLFIVCLLKHLAAKRYHDNVEEF